MKEMTRLHDLSLHVWIPPQAAHDDLCIPFVLPKFGNRASSACPTQACELVDDRVRFVGSKASSNCFS